MVTNIHHVGIVVKSLTEAYRFWVDTLGLSVVREAVIEDQGVRAALLAAGASSIELLEPTRPDTGVARFLAKHGEGLHHLCFLTPSIERDLGGLRGRTCRCWMSRLAKGSPATSRFSSQGLRWRAGRAGHADPG